VTDETTELLARQRALQTEAEGIRARLDLDRVLSAVGNPVLVGSAALGLMVWPDIDTPLCASRSISDRYSLPPWSLPRIRNARVEARPVVRR
jgi:hypothetical protein